MDKIRRGRAEAAARDAGRIVRLREVMRITGLARSTIYQKIADGEFPKQIKLGERSVGWLASEIGRWIDERIAVSRAANDDTLVERSMVA